MQPDKNLRESWVQPQLVVFGDVKELTLSSNKNLGTGDSFTFQGQTTRLSG